MHEIAPAVYLLHGLRRSNVYLLVSGRNLALVDSGLPGEVDTIASELEQGGFALSAVQTVLLTHAHADHTGGAAELAHRSGAQVWAHEAEVPFIEQTRPLATASSIKGLMLWVSERALSHVQACTVDRALREGDVIDALSGLEVWHTPGHTPGSMCLYQAEQRILFCGDLFVNRHPMTGKPGLRLAMPFVSLNMAQVRQSGRRVAALPVEILCPGHGEPILQKAQPLMQELLIEGEPQA